ncbi:MAG TPA: ABC-2 transporter permease [Blastocatellia bacterium]|nr:ABC-2 transporter permease [Blastocatellia bacterium]
MLWKKGWWETRWLFLVCLGSIFLAYGLTFGGSDYDAASWSERLQRSGNLSASELQALNNYQGQTWALGFKGLLSFIWAYMAAVLGAACLMVDCPWPPSKCASRSFTFSLPVSRRKILLSQAAVGFGEMILAALLPSLLLPIIARFHGQWFSWSDALIYMLLTILGGAVFFWLAFLMTVILGNWIVVSVMGQIVVLALYLSYLPFRRRPWWNILGVMGGESYFFHGRIPWLGLLTSLILSAVFMYAAVRIYERRDL